MAQPGSALAWGARGRRFKSSRSDQAFVLAIHYNGKKARECVVRPKGASCGDVRMYCNTHIYLYESVHFLGKVVQKKVCIQKID